MVKVALLQLRLQETKQGETIINHIIKLLKKLGDVNLDIVCLPELWYSKPINNFEKEFKMIIDIAKEQSLIIIPGAFLETINGNLHISSPVIASDGLIMGRQLRYIHLQMRGMPLKQVLSLRHLILVVVEDLSLE